MHALHYNPAGGGAADLRSGLSKAAAAGNDEGGEVKIK
jgi:hypothetical protein